MTFNAFDIVLVALLGVAGYFGYRAGPLKKSVTLGVTVVAIGLGVRLMNPIGRAVARWGVLSPAAAYVVIFALIVLLLLIATFFLYRRFGKKASPKPGGRIAGAFLGVCEAVLLVSVLLLMLKFLDFPSQRIRSGSFLYRPAVSIAPWSFDALRTILPEGEEVEEGAVGKPRGNP